MHKNIYLTDHVNPEISNLFEIIRFEDSALIMAKEIFRQISGSDRIIIINIELKHDGMRSNHCVIDVLLFLRCRFNLTNPVICVGFESLSSILLRQPQNIILCSPGILYVQLPIDFSEISNAKVPKLKELILLKPFIKPCFSLESIRHSSANYLGIAVLKEIYKALNENGNLLDSTNNITTDKVTVDMDCMMFYYNYTLKIEITNEKKNSIINMQRSILQRSPKILFIDDMAYDGWLEVFSNILFNEPTSQRIEAPASGILKRSDFSINQMVGITKPNLVLLDLRLGNEIGDIPVEELGGYKLLVRIKERFNGLPVIITSATNSVQTIKLLLEAGADAVWTKPGIDEQLSSEKIVDRYVELLQIVHNVIFRFYLTKFSRENADKILNALRYKLYLSELTGFDGINFDNFKDYREIFVDTSFLLCNSDHGVNVIDLICNFYILAYISKQKSPHQEPVVTVMNVVIDELLKKSKTENSISQNAQWVYSVVMEMFNEKIIQTEINGCYWDKDAQKNIFSRFLKDPKENSYGDAYILEEISSYLITKQKKFPNRTQDKLKEPIYNILPGRFLIIQNDKDLKKKLMSINYGKYSVIIPDISDLSKGTKDFPLDLIVELGRKLDTKTKIENIKVLANKVQDQEIKKRLDFILNERELKILFPAEFMKLFIPVLETL